MRRRRPLFTVVVLVAFLIGGSIWWLFFRNEYSSAECAPVRELLSYNKAEVDALNAKTHVPEEGSYEAAREPSDIDYRAWSDGMSDRADEVTADGLAGQARELAQTIDRLVGAKIDFNAQTRATAPGSNGPQALAMVVTAFNDEFETRVGQLSQACPA